MNPEEAVQLLVRLHPYKDQKKFEDAIRTILKEAVERAKLEGYEQVSAAHAD
jgi:hypothetical protein